MSRPERTFRTEAVILRRMDFGEADRLLTLFSPEHGKFSAIAKSARKPNARQTGHVELFARSTMLIARGRELDVVNQAELTEPFLPLREDLERVAYANYLVELLDRFTEPGEPNAPLYGLLVQALRWLSESGRDLRLAARWYELELLKLVGFQPELFRCLMGGEPIEAQDQYFSASDGGAVCPEHVEGFDHPHVIPIKIDTLKILRYLQTHPYETVKVLHIKDSLHIDLERITQFYVTYLLERRLKSIDFIRHLRHG